MGVQIERVALSFAQPGSNLLLLLCITMLIFLPQEGLWKGLAPIWLLLERSKQLPEHSLQRLCSCCRDLCGRGCEGVWKLKIRRGNVEKLCINGSSVLWDLVPALWYQQDQLLWSGYLGPSRGI